MRKGGRSSLLVFCFREKHLHVRRHYGPPAAYAFSCVPFASIRPGRRANISSQRSQSLTCGHVGGLVSLPPVLTPFCLWPKPEEEAPGEASPSRGRQDLSKPTVRAMSDGRELRVHGVASPDSPIQESHRLSSCPSFLSCKTGNKTRRHRNRRCQDSSASDNKVIILHCGSPLYHAHPDPPPPFSPASLGGSPDMAREWRFIACIWH